MPICKPTDLPGLVPEPLRLLGIDLGDRTIGLAISDAGWRLATPLETRRRSKFSRDVAALAKLFEDREVGGLVVGLPLNMDGTEGVRVQKTRDWAKELLRHHDLPLVFQDERLSTFEAEQAMIAADVSRKKRAARIDAAAAAVILEAALAEISR